MANPEGAATADASSRRERRLREVHDRIIGAAMELFEERGVESVKIDDICDAADIAQKTFFNHFPTKQHLMDEIAEGLLQELLAILAAARQEGGTTAQQLERFFSKLAADVEQSGPTHRSLIMAVIRLVHDDRTDVETSRQLYEAFGALLRDGVCKGDTTTAYPVPVLSEIVVGTFNTLMLNWLGIEDYPFRARATAMARFLGGSLRPSKPEPRTSAKQSRV